MWKHLGHSISCVFVLGLFLTSTANAADPSLVGWWSFDEGDGTVAADGSGNGYDGEIVNATWATGNFGGALSFDGSSYVEIPPESWSTIENEVTISFWAFGDDSQPVNNFVFAAYSADTNPARQASAHIPWGNGQVYWDTGYDGGTYDRVNTPLPEEFQKGAWVHWAFTKSVATGEIKIFVNGVLLISEASNIRPMTGVNVFTIGVRATSDRGIGYVGRLDDFRLYDREFSEQEIATTMEPLTFGTASTPQPQDDTGDIPRDSTLTWTAGEFAATHNVFLGTSFGDVNEASISDPRGVLLSEGLTNASIDPGRLEFGQTYYWRVDEVNSPPDSTVFTGEVWSFTVEPFSIPVTNITATASSAFGASTPEKTIDGSGLTDGLHGVSASDMWISGAVPATIEYTFDRVYKLHELRIWNSNQSIESFVGFGAKEVVIEYSLDGATWTLLEGVAPLAQAPGTDGYAANNHIDFAGATAQHVRLTVNSVQGFAPQASLSEVRFLYIPTFATRPSPGPGATGVAPEVTLSWGRDGREADTHDVYVGPEADRLDLAGNVTESSFDTTSLDLQLGQTYFWRVDEVNNTMDPSTWMGTVWSFTTVDAIVIDDMEDYADEEFKEIWATWVDGFDDPANGSLVGNGAAGTPESDRVHGGGKSLPLHYDNGASPQSEATRTFADAQDWTGHGVKSLVVHFEGSATNTGGSLYVKINDTKVAYDGDALNLMRAGWNKWVIVLADVAGANLSSVNSLTVGIDSGGQGVLYVDDILLVSEGRALITPSEPVEGLALYLPLDGDFQDASGNGRHGTAMNAPFFEAGANGQSITLNGIDQYVEIAGYKGITVVDNVQQAFTISNWFKTFENGEMVTWGASPGGQRLSWRLDGGSLRTEHGNGNLRGNTVANDGEWHHGALVVNVGANLRVPNTLLYIDGIEDSVFSGDDDPYELQPDTDVRIGSRATSNDRFFPGSIDEVRIFDRALSADEVAWLAGRRAAFDRP